MKEKKLHQMGRGDLVDIIYQYQCREQELEKEIADLKQQLKDRSLRINNAGSIAEAALSVNRVFEAAQAAADQYLEELRQLYPQKTQMQSEQTCQNSEVVIQTSTYDEGKTYDETL